jgi:hypothetical protein
MGDYLEAYARRFDLRVRTRVSVVRISRVGDRYLARHVENIFMKLRVSSRTAATAFAFEHQLV